MRIFCGQDPREAIGLHVFIASVLEHASGPVEITVITPRIAQALGVSSDGTNAFTKARYLVPHLCGYRGRAWWLDGADMLARADVHELAGLADIRSAVQVVKHAYTPKAKRKYIGTEMEADNVRYRRKNWASLMGFWCEHSACRRLTPEFVARTPGKALHQLDWVEDGRIGELPMAWNWLDEYGRNAEAKIVHYTNGIPGFEAYKLAPHAWEWRDAMAKLQRGLD